MKWQVLTSRKICGKLVTSEINHQVELKRKPKKGELYLFKTDRGTDIFKIVKVKYVPRKVHTLLVTRLRRVRPQALRQYCQLTRFYNRALAKKFVGKKTKTCLVCWMPVPIIYKEANLCPHCGAIV